MSVKINLDEVHYEISSILEEIKNGISESNFTEKEVDNLINEFLKVELQAYKVKLGFELHLISSENPSLTSKDVLVKMFSLLPSDIPKAFLPELTNFVLNEWDDFSEKLAA